MVVAADVSLPKDFPIVESKVQRPGTSSHLQAAVEHVSSGSGDLPLEELKPLLRILIECIARTYDPTVRKQASALWRALLARGGKMVFEGCMAAMMQISKRASSPTAYCTAFSWACDLTAAAALPADGTLHPHFAKLVGMHAGLLGKMATSDSKPAMLSASLNRARVSLSRFKGGDLSKKRVFTGAGEKILDLVAGYKDVTDLIGGVHLASAFFAPRNGEVKATALAGAKPKLVKLYKEAVLDATQGQDGRKAPPQLLAAFAVALKMLDHDDLAVLVPDMVHVCRRTPDLALAPLAASVLLLSADTSRYVDQLSPVVCERITTDKFRADCLAVVRALAVQSTDTSVLVELGQGLLKVLQGKGTQGQLKNWQERQGPFEALHALLLLSKGSGMVSLAADLCSPVVQLTDKEANEETKCMALRLLGTITRRTGDPTPECQKLFAKVLEGPSDLVRATALDALSEALKSTDARGAAGEMCAPLVKLTQTAEKKATLRGDAMRALRLLVLLATADAGASKKLTEAKVLPQLLGAGSHLLPLCGHDAISGTVTERQLLDLAEAVDISLREPFEGFNDRPSLVAFLARLLCHPLYSAHSAAAAAVKALAGDMPLLTALVAEICTLLAASLASEAARKPDQERDPDATHPRECFRRAILAAVPGLPPAPLLARLLLATHSKLLVSVSADGTEESGCWARLEARYPKGGEKGCLQEVLGGVMEGLCALLTGEEGAASADAGSRDAALRAISTVARLDSANAFPKLVAGVEAGLSVADVMAFSENDILIFRTPEGQLAKDAASANDYVAQKSEEKNIKISKQDRKLYGDLAAELAASKAKKPEGAAKPKMTKQEEEVFQGRLAEEHSRRLKVAEVHRRSNAALNVLAALCRGDRRTAHGHLAAMGAIVLALAPSPLLRAELPSVIAALVACCAVKLPSVVAEALFAVASADMDNVKLSTYGAVKGAVAALKAALEEEHFPPPSFTLIFPVLKFALTAPSGSAETGDAAMEVVAAHTDPRGAWPRPDMIGVMNTVMAKSPRIRKQATEVILKLCAALDATSVAELLDGCLSPIAHVRITCLDGLGKIADLPGDEAHMYLQSTLFLLRHDAETEVSTRAVALYDRCAFAIEDVPTNQLTEMLSHEEEKIRKMAGDSMAALLKLNPSAAQETVKQLKDLYVEAKTEFGAFTRSGCALALHSVAEYLSKKEIVVLFPFLVSDKEQGLSDPDELVRSQMTKAALRLIELHGEGCMELLHPMLQNQLNKPDTGTWQGDMLKEGSVILLANLAKFLPKGDPKVGDVMDRLLQAIMTPSESVQRSASTAMSPLMPMLDDPERVKQMIATTMEQLMGGETYGDRRGAAFGLAGMVKGLGISALKAHDIMPSLQEAATNKKDVARRQGALFGFELLSERLGRLFEPYVIHILPILLNSCGDADEGVREAAEHAARAVMSQLSGQGVKLVMPALLQGVEDRAWRTKSAAIDLLGAMAYCAPRQLGTCLPTIVPVMANAVSDTHPKVREGAITALGHVGNVIKNPEILAIAPLLLESLSNPDKTAKALEVVIETTFVNAVDAPSLALLIPVVQRGLKQSSADSKKKAATIVGNMCNLVSDPKDVSPYLGDLIPIIKQSILDHSPEMRQIAANALGSLVKSMDSATYEELERYLLFTCKSEEGIVVRGGAALGLASILSSSSIDRWDNVMAEVLLQCRSNLSFVRDGYFTLLSCLPAAMGDRLEPYIPQLLPTILKGLSDEMEDVREVALRAGHGVVDNYAETAMPLVLPAIEEGLFDTNWRIRSSSVHLLGDVLSKITGRNWKTYTGGSIEEQDEGIGDRNSEAKIAEVLGEELRNKLFAAVYMLRSDVNQSVCSASFQVWKSVVQSQARTLRTILDTLMGTLISCLSSPSPEKQAVAGKSMGEMVAKLGDRVLYDVIPILQKGLASDEELLRAGVCLGLSEVIGSCQRNQLTTHMEDLVSTVRRGLCDSAPSVRGAAAQAFDALYKAIQQRAIEEVVPSLLNALQEEGEGGALALQGLQQLLTVRGKIVLPFLVPQLATPPMTARNARALAALSAVAGDALSSKIPTILGALSDGMSEGDDPEVIALAAEKVILAVPQEGVRMMLLELLRRLEDVTTPQTRAAAARLLTAFCGGTTHDYEDYKAEMIKMLVHLFGDPTPAVTTAANGALAAIVKHLEGEDKKEDPKAPAVSCGAYVSTVHQEVMLLQATAPPGGISGFNATKGLAPILPFFLQALMHGATPETRALAADGLGLCVEATSEAALKPMVVQMSGPLIRIIGDRFPWQVKAAILSTLSLLLVRGGIMMKPFLPQLQTTFVKSLSESSKVVRARAVGALAKMVKMAPRVDPLLNDLVAGCRGAEGTSRISFITALEVVTGRAGKAATPVALASVEALLQDLMASPDDEVRLHAAAAYGAHASLVADEEILGIVNALLEDETAEWTRRHGNALAVAALMKYLLSEGRSAAADNLGEAMAGHAKMLAKSDRAPVREAGAKAMGQSLILFMVDAASTAKHAENAKTIFKEMARMLADTSPEVKLAALKALKAIARAVPDEILNPFLDVVVMPAFACQRDKVVAVRTAAERTVLHLLRLYAGEDVAEDMYARIKGSERNLLSEYVKRLMAKGADACEASDEGEEGVDQE